MCAAILAAAWVWLCVGLLCLLRRFVVMAFGLVSLAPVCMTDARPPLLSPCNPHCVTVPCPRGDRHPMRRPQAPRTGKNTLSTPLMSACTLTTPSRGVSCRALLVQIKQTTKTDGVITRGQVDSPHVRTCRVFCWTCSSRRAQQSGRAA